MREEIPILSISLTGNWNYWMEKNSRLLILKQMEELLSVKIKVFVYLNQQFAFYDRMNT